MRVIINGTDITKYIRHRGVKWSRNDVDGPNAGRNLSGTMIRDRVATKIRLDVNCKPLTDEEHSRLMNILSPDRVSVSYDDPCDGFVTKIMYANNHSSEYLMRTRATEYWYNVSFPLIEI